MTGDAEIDPMELYDMVLSDSQELDQALGGDHYVKDILETLGTREEFAKKIGYNPAPKSQENNPEPPNPAQLTTTPSITHDYTWQVMVAAEKQAVVTEALQTGTGQEGKKAAPYEPDDGQDHKATDETACEVTH